MDDFYKAKVLGLLVSNLRRRAEKLGWGWPVPTNVMEELAELLMLTGGVLGPSGASLNYAELAQERVVELLGLLSDEEVEEATALADHRLDRFGTEST